GGPLTSSRTRRTAPTSNRHLLDVRTSLGPATPFGTTRAAPGRGDGKDTARSVVSLGRWQFVGVDEPQIEHGAERADRDAGRLADLRVHLAAGGRAGSRDRAGPRAGRRGGGVVEGRGDQADALGELLAGGQRVLRPDDGELAEPAVLTGLGHEPADGGPPARRGGEHGMTGPVEPHPTGPGPRVAPPRAR